MAFLFETGWTATFDDTKTYRYELVRQFKSVDASRCVVIMLNPSTATAFKNDPTVTRVCKFAELWGHTSLVVLNLFALRSTDPKRLLEYPNPVGPDNDKYLYSWLTAPLTKRVICAWGNWGRVGGRAAEMLPKLREWCRPRQLECFGLTKHGFPKHPLARGKEFIPYSKEPEVFRG